MNRLTTSVIALLLIVGAYYVFDKDKRNDTPAPPVAVLPPSTMPVPPLVLDQAPAPRVTRWFYLDDMVTSLATGFKGDPNGPQDLAYAIALALHYNNFPMGIGVTPTRNGRDSTVTKKLIGLSGFDIPVYYGATSNSMAPSELSRKLVEESRRGPLSVVIGGTATDLAQALKDGANGNNITVVGTLYGTSNEKGDQAAADYVRGRVKFINMGSPEYQALLWQMPKHPALVDGVFIDSWRGIPMWDAVFSDAIIFESSRLNAYQFRHYFKSRFSDRMNVDRLLSGHPET